MSQRGFSLHVGMDGERLGDHSAWCDGALPLILCNLPGGWNKGEGKGRGPEERQLMYDDQ